MLEETGDKKARVLNVNSVFKIKNTKFIISLKKMIKLVRGGHWRRYERQPLKKFNERRSQWQSLNFLKDRRSQRRLIICTSFEQRALICH